MECQLGPETLRDKRTRRVPDATPSMVPCFLLPMAFHGACLMVEFKLSDIKETKPLEIGVRFLFGGICTVGAGLIAKRYGAGIGGSFWLFRRSSRRAPP